MPRERKALYSLSAGVLVCALLLSAATTAYAEPAADQECSASTYDPNLSASETDAEGKKGLIGEPCSQTQDGQVISGTCTGANTCEAVTVNGRTPELPTQDQMEPGTGAEAPPDPTPSSSNNFPASQLPVNSLPGPIFDETTGQWKSQPMLDETPYRNDIPDNPGALPATANVFNETTGLWETQSLPAGCSLIFDTCGPSAAPPTYPMIELPENPLGSGAPMPQPGTVLQYDEAAGAQNYQYAFPPQPTFNGGANSSGPGVQTPTVSIPNSTGSSPSPTFFQRFLNWLDSILQ